MKCPRCGQEMTLDEHRKIDMFMCYECGYIEGRNTGDTPNRPRRTNYERLRDMNLNEAAAFMAGGLGVDENRLYAWLESPTN